MKKETVDYSTFLSYNKEKVPGIDILSADVPFNRGIDLSDPLSFWLDEKIFYEDKARMRDTAGIDEHEEFMKRYEAADKEVDAKWRRLLVEERMNDGAKWNNPDLYFEMKMLVEKEDYYQAEKAKRSGK